LIAAHGVLYIAVTVQARVRAAVLVVFAVATAAAAGFAAFWVNERERAADAAARSPRPAASASSELDAGPGYATAEAVSVHFDNPHAPSLPAEMAALGAARFHNQAGHPELALQQLERVGSRFPQGALRSERMAELAIAQCALGKRAEAGQTLADLARLAAPAELVSRARTACEHAKATATP
jgi:hypothetical protein